MSFESLEFAFFLPVVFAAYWALPARAALQNGFLVLAGVVFYASWSWGLVWVFALAGAVDYAIARYLEAARGTDGAARRRMRLALGLSVAYNVGQLCWFKYVGFFADSANALLHRLGFAADLPVLRLALPIGLSYWTLQKLSYVLDVYYGRVPACRSPLTFAAFASFFPQLVAGPIVRASETLPQLAKARRLDPDALGAGARAFLLGFAMKAFVADFLGQKIVDPVFADPAAYSAAGHWMGLVGYAAQVFGDFAGYSLMAIGAGRLFGIELPVNFDYPFFSTNLMEFWRRWHITLNRWFFDHLYAPLVAGNGWFKGRFDLGFLVVFAVSGLWHGATWGFVLWGLMHGVGLVAQRRWGEYYKTLCRKDRVWVQRRKSRGYKAAAWCLTIGFFVVSLVPFRAGGLDRTVAFAGGLFAAPGATLPGLDSPMSVHNLAWSVVFLAGYHALGTAAGRRGRARLAALPPVARGVAYGAAIVFMFVFMPTSGSTFVYANF
jgi:alginate O-acetyltransferase complex protein AlgI